MNIGILKEPEKENRVAIIPDTVKNMADLKQNIVVERGAGGNSFYSDKDYEEAGATVADRKKILTGSDVIVSIHPLSEKELSSVPEKTVMVAVFNPFFNKEVVQAMKTGNITSLSLDLLPRISRAQSMDILSSMATVAGYKAILLAASELPKFFPMFMSAAGTIKPAKMLILGAGVAGLQALSVARKLGAVVEVFDVRAAVKEEVLSLGGKFVEVEGAVDDAKAGGYAVEQSEEYKQKQAQAIHDHAIKANVVICTAQIPGKRAPVLVKKETVAQMAPGAVIIDLAASTGGNCELTKNDETVVSNGVKIVGKSDFPSDMPMDASQMFSKNVFNFMKLLVGEDGALNLNFEDEIVKGSCLTYEKEIINERVKNIS